VENDAIGALAHLQLGRAYTMQGDTTKAKAAAATTRPPDRLTKIRSPALKRL